MPDEIEQVTEAADGAATAEHAAASTATLASPDPDDTTNFAKHFSIPQLMRFALPSMGMMIFMSLYVMVDGFFVSNFTSETAFAAVNFTYPIISILGTLGFMFGTGGSAIVAKTRGEGDPERANRQFSLLVYAGAVAGVIFAVVGIFALRPLLQLMGAEGNLLEECMKYGGVLVICLPTTILQYLFQELMITAGKPDMAFHVTVASGITNIILDAVLIAGMRMGVIGAAIGTVAGEMVGSLIPIIYFARPNTSALRLGRTNLDWKMLGKTCVNGSSEMVSNIAASLVGIVYNVQLLAYLGEAGVSVYGIIEYIDFLAVAILIGYVSGTSPLMSFQYGAGNRKEMQSLFAKSVAIVVVIGFAMFLTVRIAAEPLGGVFVGYDPDLHALTTHALLIYSWKSLFTGMNMYGSSLFTALSNGGVSAVISFVRTLIFEIGAVLLLPGIFGPDGIWYAVTVANAVAFIMTLSLVLGLSKRYGYLPKKFGEALRD